EAWFELAPLTPVHSTQAVQSSPARDRIARGPRVLPVPRLRLCSFQPPSFRARRSPALSLLLSGCPRHAEFLWPEGSCSRPHCSGQTAQRNFLRIPHSSRKTQTMQNYPYAVETHSYYSRARCELFFSAKNRAILYRIKVTIVRIMVVAMLDVEVDVSVGGGGGGT